MLKHPTLSWIVLFFIPGLTLSIYLDPVYSSTLIFLLIIFSVTFLFYSENYLQASAVVAAFFIGLSPLYLIFRGFITRNVLNQFDLQIYASLFFFLAFCVKLLTCKNNEKKFLNRKLSSFSQIFWGLLPLWLGVIIHQVLLNKSIGNAVAWSASGDSKNHLVNGVSISGYGFLDPTTFYTQPVSSPTYLALTLSQGNERYSNSTELLQYQMFVYSHVWIILLGALGLTFASTTQLVWNRLQDPNKNIPFLALICSSLIPTFSYLLGSALFDGFFTAIFGICSIILMTNWLLQITEKKFFSINSIFLGLTIFATTLMAWMFVVPFSFAILIWGIRNSLLKKVNFKLYLDTVLVTLLLAVVIAVHFSNFGQQLIKYSKLALNTPGAANVTHPNLFYAEVLILIILGIILKNKNRVFGDAVLSVGMIQLIVLFLFKLFSNLSLLSWNYYLLKYQWIMFASISSLVFSFILVKIMLSLDQKKLTQILAISLTCVATFLISESIVGVNRVFQKITDGWDNPRAIIIDKMFEFEINNKVPTLFFHYGYSGESRMANFWLTAFADPIEPIKGWNYTIDTTGSPQQMCDLNYYYPEVKLITSDVNLQKELSELCPAEKFTVVLEKPIFPDL